MKIPYRFKDLPRETKATHLLNVFMTLPFSIGKNTFLVDAITITPETVTGSLEGRVIVQFPATYQYMLISLENYNVLTDEELEEEERKIKEEEGQLKGSPPTEEDLLNRGYV